MYKGLFSKLPHSSNLFIIAIVILITFLFTNVIGIIASVFIFKLSLTDFMNILKNLNYNNHYQINILKLFQMVQTIGLFIIPPFLLAWLFSEQGPSEYLQINKKAGLITFFLAAIIMYTCMPLIEWMLEINSSLKLPHQLHEMESWMKDSEDTADKITKAFLNITTFQGLALNLLMIGLLPAIGEELMFRGFLLRFFRDWTKNSHFAIIISAIIFSVIHFQFYGFLPRMMLGILFGYLFVWSGSIWVPVFVHFINNSTAVIASYLQSKGLIKTDIDKMFSFDKEYLYIAMSIITSTVLIWLFHYYSKQKQKLTNQEG
jgi:uncharacterized protein